MSIEQHFAAAINAAPDDRTLQLVYANWLDEQGDPRAEGWRVLIEAGKWPFLAAESSWDWYIGRYKEHCCLPEEMIRAMDKTDGRTIYAWGYPSFFAAMDAAAIAWVRCHRDADFEPDELTEGVN